MLSVLALGEQLAGQRVELGDALDLVAEELDADDDLRRCGLDLERVAADPERARPSAASLRWYWRSTRWRRTESRRYMPPTLQAAGPSPRSRRARRGRRCTDTDATMITSRRSNSAWVAACRSRSISSFRRRVLLDVRVRPRQVRLGLVVVEVADEVLDRVVREELAELRVELRGERLVVGQDQRRLVVAAR